MRSTIVAMYSGQQKFATSSVTPVPGPPPVESPKPWPRAPVTATALPALVTAPFVGVRPRASSVDSLMGVAGDAFVGFAFGLGSVISGVFAAGGRTASGRLT